MRRLPFIAAFVVAAFLFFTPAPSHAQVSVAIGVGGPVCPYGYYGFGAYRCAPRGYYGPEWFAGGRFIGAGRYYHGDHPFYGQVNRGFDPRYGYHGGYPARGVPYREGEGHFEEFHGNAYHDHYGRPAPNGYHPH